MFVSSAHCLQYLSLTSRRRSFPHLHVDSCKNGGQTQHHHYLFICLHLRHKGRAWILEGKLKTTITHRHLNALLFRLLVFLVLFLFYHKAGLGELQNKSDMNGDVVCNNHSITMIDHNTMIFVHDEKKMNHETPFSLHSQENEPKESRRPKQKQDLLSIFNANNNNNNITSQGKHQKRGVYKKERRSALKSASRKNSQNRKVTDYFPIRRSSRKSKTELQCEQKKILDELILKGREEGMEVQQIEGKGRAVFATRSFQKGEYVVEYHGDLLQINDAKQRETEYAQNPATGCYMYYFQYLCKTYCVDATKETGRLGRLINHSKNGNCQTKLHDINGVPHLILVASRNIDEGEELLYDYGDRSKASIAAHPWLKE